MSNLVYGIIMIAVSFIGAFVLTIVIGFQDEEAQADAEKNTSTAMNMQKKEMNDAVYPSASIGYPGFCTGFLFMDFINNS